MLTHTRNTVIASKPKMKIKLNFKILMKWDTKLNKEEIQQIKNKYQDGRIKPKRKIITLNVSSLNTSIKIKRLSGHTNSKTFSYMLCIEKEC